DDVGLKGQKREAMENLPVDRKLYLLAQNRQMRSHSSSAPSPVANRFASYSPSTAPSFFPNIVPQLTGGTDSVMKRFSIATLTGWGTPSAAQPSVTLDHGERSRSSSLSDSSSELMTPQSTGGLFGSWWNRSGSAQPIRPDVTGASEITHDPSWYISELNNLKRNEVKLARHLINLRVHLSTAQLGWINTFAIQANGVEALGSALKEYVGDGLLRKKKGDAVQTIVLELVKCLRVLLNTEVTVLDAPAVVTHIVFTLHGASDRLRTLASEVLAAICVLSPSEGEKLVMSAFSEYRIAHAEIWRFEETIAFLKSGMDGDEFGREGDDITAAEDEQLWEAKTATMALINALANCPDELEERIVLREEFSRRGLNEAIVALRYMQPPEHLLKQLSVYTEEKFEDEEDLRERSLTQAGHPSARGVHSASGSHDAFDALMVLANGHDDLEVSDIIESIIGLWTELLKQPENQL
ncbi:hypothetical protein DL93DRAFT_2059759, partial [Clavulina sp. PMI_390]